MRFNLIHCRTVSTSSSVPSNPLHNWNLVSQIKNSLSCCTGLHHRPINTECFGQAGPGHRDYLGSFNSQIKRGFSYKPWLDRGILLSTVKTIELNVETRVIGPEGGEQIRVAWRVVGFQTVKNTMWLCDSLNCPSQVLLSSIRLWHSEVTFLSLTAQWFVKTPPGYCGIKLKRTDP